MGSISKSTNEALPSEAGVIEPPIEYVRTGGVSIAYQVMGSGPVDLVYVPLNLSIAVGWEQPIVARFYERLASLSRLILLDKRGTGISDRPRAPLTLEAQMDDVRAVLDAVGSEQAALLGGAQGAQMCALFAATYPERSSALILWNARARFAGTEEEKRSFLRMIYEQWGTEEWIDYLLEANYPSFVGDPDFRRWMAKGVRISASPGSALEFLRTFAEADIGDVLPTIRAPTLVMYRRDMATKALFTRDLAQEAERLVQVLPNARLTAVPGRDMAPYVGDEVAEEVERFLASPEAPVVPDRVLATVLFTDIVDSTQTAATLGDRRWRDLLTEHRKASGASSRISAARRWTPPATASSPPSTGLHGRSRVRAPSSERRTSMGSCCVPGGTRASAKSRTTRSPAWRSTSVHGWSARRDRAKFSSRTR